MAVASSLPEGYSEARVFPRKGCTGDAAVRTTEFVWSVHDSAGLAFPPLRWQPERAMKKRMFTAGFGHESNSFSPLPTGLQSFREYMLWRPGDAPLTYRGMETGPLDAARALVHADPEWELVEGTLAYATPSAPLTRFSYETLRDEILGQMEAALPLDAVALSLHGAMLAEGYPDCEGDLLARARSIIASGAALGAELDLHCHISPEMTGAADVLVAFKEYPHSDYAARGEELVSILARCARGEVRPHTTVFDCRQIGLYHTPVAPMRGFVDRMQALEREPGVLSVSAAHGFPWGDTPHIGTKVLVTTDDRPELGAEIAASLGADLRALRGRGTPPHLSLEEGLARAGSTSGGPVVLADIGDNSGGGAANDSTFVARAMIDAGMHDTGVGPLWDPVAVDMCRAAGVGARLALRIGGKVGPQSGAPLDLEVEVVGISEHANQTFAGEPSPLGNVAGVRSAKGMCFVLNDLRTQAFGADLFNAGGFDPASFRYLVVKSAQHFYDGFAPIAREIVYLASPGTMTFDITTLPFEHRPQELWPFNT